MQTIIPITKGLLLYTYLNVFSLNISGQIPAGAWRDHLPYSHAKKVAEFDNRIFCSTSDGSLFSYNLQDKNIVKHSKVNGLSDADISTIGSSIDTKTLLIGYTNGNIDLIKNDSIINLPDIFLKSIMGNKSINNAYFYEQKAYLSCSFGIVVCDLLRREIKDTYIIGPNGTYLNVNNITSDGIYLYAATNKGVYKADLNDPNLLDFNACVKFQALPDPDAEYRFIVSYDNKLFTIYHDEASGYDHVITFNDLSWENWDKVSTDVFYFLGEQQGSLALSSVSRTQIFGSQETLLKDFVSYSSMDVLIDSRQGLWYASAFGGLIMMDESNNGSLIVPEGPMFREAGDIEIFSGNVWVGGGNFKSQWTGYGAYSFIDEKWKNYNGNTMPSLKDVLNISEISIDPLDPTHIVGGSYGYGIVEFRNDELVDIENETGGVLQSVSGFNEPGYVRITGTDIDKNGNIYAASSETETAVYKKSTDSDWSPVKLNYDQFGSGMKIGELLVTSIGQVWLLLTDQGILAFNEENNTAVQEKFFVVKNQEGDILKPINSIAEDKDGNIWIGTANGPVVYSETSEIFETGVITGYQPVIPRNDGTTYASLLLSSESINDIEVDGANRKWMATDKSGVFLLSEDGKTEIAHFTVKNSPLLSNSVQTVAVNDKTGEVFFGTEKGIISYRGTATEGGDDFGDVYVFPNPVRETFQGDITITGLMNNVNVKITDIAGNLVFETTALGGQAIWNGRNFHGDRVQTGIYLIFCTNEDGSKTYITKLLLIH